jgi:hypothetical protein
MCSCLPGVQFMLWIAKITFFLCLFKNVLECCLVLCTRLEGTIFLETALGVFHDPAGPESLWCSSTQASLHVTNLYRGRRLGRPVLGYPLTGLKNIGCPTESANIPVPGRTVRAALRSVRSLSGMPGPDRILDFTRYLSLSARLWPDAPDRDLTREDLHDFARPTTPRTRKGFKPKPS